MSEKNELPDEFIVSIDPDVSALRMFKNMSFTPWYALGEFVDNSITSALHNEKELIKRNGKDYQLKVSINFPPDQNSLIVIDNAAGISSKDMVRALKTGVPPETTDIGLSKHGVGMKAASLWWGEHVIIDTHPIDEPNGWHVEIDISEKGDINSAVTVKKIPHQGFPGTRLEVNGLWRRTPQARTVTSIKSYLPSIYRAFLGETHRPGQLKCSIYYQDKALTFEYPELLNEPVWHTTNGPVFGELPRVWRKEFTVKLKTGKEISGWVGILDRLSRDLSGFFLHYRGKGIAGVVPISVSSDENQEEAKDAISKGAYKPRRIFKQQGSYPDQSFIGEFDITDFGKTITTDSPLWTADEENEFIEELFNKLSDDDFIRMATNFRRKKAAKADEVENTNSDEKESVAIEGALDGNVDHDEISEPAGTIDTVGNLLDPDLIEDSLSISVSDKEGHQHKFQLKFVKDVSRDFLVLLENAEEMNHEIQVNIFHPSLNGINMDLSSRKTLQRICLALAASEVFNSGYDKTKIRNKMNEILSQLGAKRLGE